MSRLLPVLSASDRKTVYFVLPKVNVTGLLRKMNPDVKAVVLEWWKNTTHFVSLGHHQYRHQFPQQNM